MQKEFTDFALRETDMRPLRVSFIDAICCENFKGAPVLWGIIIFSFKLPRGVMMIAAATHLLWFTPSTTLSRWHFTLNVGVYFAYYDNGNALKEWRIRHYMPCRINL